MIVSHKHRFIFLKTKKVGGTSLEIALSALCGPRDIITPISTYDETKRKDLGFRSPQNYLKPVQEWVKSDYTELLRWKIPSKYYNHMPAAKARSYLGEATWQSYFKFTVIRDPFEAAVSMFFFSARPSNAASLQDQFRAFLLRKPQVLVENQQIYMLGDEVAVDKIVRYEDLQGGLLAVSERLGLRSNVFDTMKKIKAKADFRPPTADVKTMFSGFGEGVDLVRILARHDIALGGYESPLGSATS